MCYTAQPELLSDLQPWQTSQKFVIFNSLQKPVRDDSRKQQETEKESPARPRGPTPGNSLGGDGAVLRKAALRLPLLTTEMGPRCGPGLPGPASAKPGKAGPVPGRAAEGAGGRSWPRAPTWFLAGRAASLSGASTRRRTAATSTASTTSAAAEPQRPGPARPGLMAPPTDSARPPRPTPGLGSRAAPRAGPAGKAKAAGPRAACGGGLRGRGREAGQDPQHGDGGDRV